jgi:hypothetical protein
MLTHTRRRALGLFIAAGVGARLISPMSRALAADAKKPDCYAAKDFGPWKAQATDKSAGAIMSQLALKGTNCDLTADVKIASTYDAKLVVYGDPFGTRLPKKFLIKPDNRFIARDADGAEIVNVQLCGNCTDIFDDKVSIILPLDTAPLLRDADAATFAIKLGEKEECQLKLDCANLHKALEWATTQRDAFKEKSANNECSEVEQDCFITTACCEALGLDDDCFELRTLRRYRDQVLVKQTGGAQEIAHYDALAPQILARLRTNSRKATLLSVYARYVLPAALAARLGFNRLAYRLYVAMLNEFAGADVTTGAGIFPRPLPLDVES